MAVILVSILEVLEQVSLVAVIVGLAFGNAPALYVTALIANLCQAGFIFVRFVGSAFRHEFEDGVGQTMPSGEDPWATIGE